MKFIFEKQVTTKVFSQEAFNDAVRVAERRFGSVPIKVLLNSEDYEAAMQVFSRPQIKYAPIPPRNYMRPLSADDFGPIRHTVSELLIERKSCGEPEFIFRITADSF